MARLCAALCTSHSPFLYSPPADWEPARLARAAHGGIAADTPVDTPAENARKHARCNAALEVLRGVLKEARPDVIVVLGDDQGEQFDFANFPALGIFAGETYAGFKISEFFGLPVPGRARERRPRTPEHWVEMKGHPALARALITRLVAAGFDISFSLKLPRPDAGIGHAFTRPFVHLAPDYDIPVVPIFVNCYFGPQPTAKRCAALGRALRRAIVDSPLELNVAVIGSGGLWHLPMQPNARLDESFDRTILEHLARGDTDGLASYFDSRSPSFDAADTASLAHASGGTGMVLGYGGGTGETRNWIITAAVVDGVPGTVVDYVPVYASPVGLAFAYWKLDETRAVNG